MRRARKFYDDWRGLPGRVRLAVALVVLLVFSMAYSDTKNRIFGTGHYVSPNY